MKTKLYLVSVNDDKMGIIKGKNEKDAEKKFIEIAAESEFDKEVIEDGIYVEEVQYYGN